jgi:hypothetical protein
MNNIKKIALGLLVGAMAIGFSAFTNASAKTNFATRYWTNNGTNYVLLSGTPNPADHCGSTSSSAECAVESNDSSIPNSFPISNPSHYSIATYPGSSKSVYQ